MWASKSEVKLVELSYEIKLEFLFKWFSEEYWINCANFEIRGNENERFKKNEKHWKSIRCHTHDIYYNNGEASWLVFRPRNVNISTSPHNIRSLKRCVKSERAIASLVIKNFLTLKILHNPFPWVVLFACVLGKFSKNSRANSDCSLLWSQ